VISNVSVITVRSFKDHRKHNAILLERGMTVEECRKLFTSCDIPIREKLFFRMIYETLLQPSEVLNLQIENWDRECTRIIATKVMIRTKPLKGDVSKKVLLPAKPKVRSITLDTNDMLKEYVGNRKKGPIFTNNQTGERISLKWFNKAINKYAKLLDIQQIKKYFKDKTWREKPRTLKLVTLMALKKAGGHNEYNQYVKKVHDNKSRTRKNV
jgi:integrase